MNKETVNFQASAPFVASSNQIKSKGILLLVKNKPVNHINTMQYNN